MGHIIDSSMHHESPNVADGKVIGPCRGLLFLVHVQVQTWSSGSGISSLNTDIGPDTGLHFTLFRFA